MSYITYHGNVGTASEVPVKVPVGSELKTCMFRREATGQMAWTEDADGETVWAYLDEIDETGEYYKRTEKLVDDGKLIPTLAAMQPEDFEAAIAGIRDLNHLRRIAKDIVNIKPAYADIAVEQIARMTRIQAMHDENEAALAKMDEGKIEKEVRKTSAVNSKLVKAAVKAVKQDSSLASSRDALADAIGVDAINDAEFKEIGKQLAS